MSCKVPEVGLKRQENEEDPEAQKLLVSHAGLAPVAKAILHLLRSSGDTGQGKQKGGS
jgi:hypothetical protein